MHARLPRSATYAIAAGFALDLVRRLVFLLDYEFPSPRGAQLAWLVIGCVFGGALLWRARVFEKPTAAKIVRWFGGLILADTACYATLFLSSAWPNYLLHTLSLGFDILILRACRIHAKALRRESGTQS
jgi:hypothetical protein